MVDMVQNISSNELKRIILQEKKPAMALFTGAWCVDCTAFKPTWERWTKSRNGPLYVLDIKRGDSAWQDWNLPEIPTVAVYMNGEMIGKASDRISSGDLDRLWKMLSPG